MWLLTWRLATFGVPFEFESASTVTQLVERLQKRSIWHSLRKSDEASGKIAFRVRATHFVAFVAKISFWVLARPVYYAEFQANGTRTVISGKFFLQKMVRVSFWLTLCVVLLYEIIWFNRLFGALSNQEGWDQLIGYLAMLLPGLLLGFFEFCCLVWFTRHNANDMSDILDALKTITTQ